MGKYWSQSEQAKKRISEAAQKRYENNSKMMQCLNCKQEYKIPLSRYKSGRGKYCSKNCMTKDFKGKHLSPSTEFIKGQKAWNKGIAGKDSHMHGKQNALGYSWSDEQLEKLRGRKPWNKGKKTGLAPWLGKKRPDITGNLNSNWTGDKASYAAIHQWLSKQYGQPKYCENCGNTDPSKRYEWSCISGEHRRDRQYYWRLCKKCHNNYDGVNAWQQKR